MDKFKKHQRNQQDQQQQAAAAVQSILLNKQTNTRSNEIIEITQEDIDKYDQESSLLMKALRSFFKGFIFGFQFRLIYSLGMLFFFKIDRPLLKTLRQIFVQTFEHAFLLGQHCSLYQIIFGIMSKIFKEKKKFNSVITGFFIGCLLYRDKTFVKQTIILYLLSRSLYSTGTKLQEKKVFPKIKFWPYLAAFCWGMTMFFYETDRTTLTTSVEQSLKYLLSEQQGREWYLPRDVPKILEKALLV